MALIQCPNCNKSISDTANKCVHCGFDMSTGEMSQAAPQDFDSLPAARKDALRDEFYAKYPKYGEVNNGVYNTLFILNLSYICWGVAVIVLALARVLHIIFKINPQTEYMAVMLVAMIALFAIGIIAQIVIRIILNKQMKAECLILKKYKQWLLTEKSISMQVYFEKAEAKYKKYFDSVNVEMEVW